MKSKALLIFVLIIVIILGGVAIWLGLKLSKKEEEIPTLPETGSEEVWSAERSDLADYANGWSEVLSVSDIDIATVKTYLLSDAGARFIQSAEILKVDEETLYGRDLNYYFWIYNFKAYASADKLVESELDSILDIMMTDSFLLQQASDLSLVSLDSTVYNSNAKDLKKRFQVVGNVKEQLGDRLVQKASFEYVSIWFRNTEVPISVEEGRAVAEEKINALYDRLLSGEITMEEAGDIIKSDTEIGEKCDPAYKNNAYGLVTDWEKGVSYFHQSTNLDTSLWSLGEGQMSTVVVGQEIYYPPDNPTEEETIDVQFIIIKMNLRSSAVATEGESYESTDEMLDQKQEEAESNSDIIIKNN